MGKTIAITGINSYIALPLRNKLDEDQDVEKLKSLMKIRMLRR